MMKLFLEVKKTNKHLYLHILANKCTIYVVSTNRRFLRDLSTHFSNLSIEALLSYILSNKIKEYGFTQIYLKQNNVYHGHIQKIKEFIQKNGITVM